jgi:hypothetical protein
VVNVGFPPGTRVTARPANVAVSGKYNISDLAPSLVLLSHRIVERWLLQPSYPKEPSLQFCHVISQCGGVAISVEVWLTVNGRTLRFYRQRFILATSPSRAVSLL